ncbi:MULTISPECIES: 30S ribosomal protein S15 [Prosthecochloris]|uniref:Small ribosomal subunit protein uS15 n=1 Tax=Prosthecochloris vibrioformis TaxID=1098 RepID=A0A5C4S0A2_PROVB|nr:MULTISPECIES: 30S ribosomal protein S15 [Prosthecochloris]ANT64187.1 30S ribosomal protein S15 [Prosthecochloris sp. CIB 2401]TNJ36619.1 30S ribosomal protein S15 [Prosthecochloris vibrioformis]
MSLTKDIKAEIIGKFGGSEKNTGKTEVQIALYSRRISDLTGHLKEHPKDNHSRHGLLKLVGKRKSLLGYLKDTDIERYRQVLADLDLRK